MTLDSTLWTAFDSTKTALLRGIRDSLATISPLHILSVEPRSRKSARSSISETIDELEELRAQLMSAVIEIDDVSKEVQSSQRHVQASLVPIVALPPEIIRHVSRFASDGRDGPTTILNMSHVCSDWRQIVMKTPELFIEADWSRWNVELISLWLHRGNGRPHTIRLEDGVVHDIFSNNNWFATFTLAMWDCVELWIDVEGRVTMSRFSDWFLSCTPSSLEHLRIRHLSSHPGLVTVVVPENAPALRKVQFHGVLPIFRDFRHITEFTCVSSSPDWVLWADVLGNLHHLEKLRIEDIVYDDLDENIAVELPALRTLELHGGESEQEPLRVVNSIVAPELRNLILVNIGFWDGDIRWNSIVSVLVPGI